MCGIFAYISKVSISKVLQDVLYKLAFKAKWRGPDNTVEKLVTSKIYLNFHRLCIMDVTDAGNQPLVHPQDSQLSIICNGEIYNWDTLAKENGFKLKSGSDCEVILHMYKKFGIKKTIESLDGVFAFVLIDRANDKVFVGRDPIGVRSLFWGKAKDGSTVFASELKQLHLLVDNAEQFTPGCFMEVSEGVMHRWYNYVYPLTGTEAEDTMKNIKELFEKATTKRLMSDRPVGCLLSGGLDSSLVVALVARQFKKGELQTFSVGLKGSEDLRYARMVAEHCGTKHHEIIVTEAQMLEAIEDDIKTIESYDITTVRASTPMYLMSQYIKKNTDITVVYSGEGSDEASGSYMYFHKAPSPEAFKAETIRLMEDLIYFDVLRCDKSTSGAGLEVRVPFLDKEFLQYYLGIDPKLKMPGTFGIEKYLLRKAFDVDDLLPKQVLWRVKEGMSDGVSSKKKSWFQIIQDHCELIISDKDFKESQALYEFNKPMIKEALYYRRLFDRHYKGQEKTIPYYWLPKWCGDVSEPSARVLTCYNEQMDEQDVKDAKKVSEEEKVDEQVLQA